MARLDGISDEEASFVVGQVFRIARKRTGEVPEPLRIMAKSGGTMWGAGLFQMAFDRAQTVDRKLKTLACIKAASTVGCLF